MTIGARSRIGHGTVVGGVPQDLKYRDGLPVGVRIGDDTVIREHVTIHRASQAGHDTSVGDHCMVMVSSHIAHDCSVGNHVIIINYAGLTGHVTVEDHVTVGGHSGIHPFGRVGTHAYIGGFAKVIQDVPPFIMVDGNPATARAVNVIGMRRGGIEGESRRRMQSAFRILYRSGLAPGTAIGKIKAELGDDPLVARLLDFIQASPRGIVPAPDNLLPEPARRGGRGMSPRVAVQWPRVVRPVVGVGREAEAGMSPRRPSSRASGAPSSAPATWGSITRSPWPSSGAWTWSAWSTSTWSAPSGWRRHTVSAPSPTIATSAATSTSPRWPCPPIAISRSPVISWSRAPTCSWKSR